MEIRLEGVTKKYKDIHAVKDFSASLPDGKLICLLGPSGCGKTTLLNMLCGIIPVTSGKIFFDQLDVTNLEPDKRHIGMVFQNYALYPHLNVRENISLGLKVRGCAKCEINRRVELASEILKLDEYLNRKPKELSGGQRQRVALARAIVREPKVFLMDEPLSNLDAKLRCEMRSEIKKLHNKLKTTFIYVTHDQTEALTMGDRIVVLDKGKIQQADTPEEIYNNPKNIFVAGFIGQMNFINVNINQGRFYVNGIEFTTDKAIAGDITVGIRTEKMLSGKTEIKIKPEIIEMSGSEKNVYFSLNNSKCSAKIPMDYNFDDKIMLNVSDMYFFDKETGERI